MDFFLPKRKMEKIKKQQNMYVQLIQGKNKFDREKNIYQCQFQS